MLLNRSLTNLGYILGSVTKKSEAHKYYLLVDTLMHKQTTFVLTAAILLTAIVSVTLYTVKAANAQSNMTTGSGANMTKSNMTNATSGTAKNMTGAAKSIIGGAMGSAKSAIGSAIGGAGK
jgi:hypothetical protein